MERLQAEANPRAALFMAFKAEAVEAVRVTEGEWRFGCGYGGGREGGGGGNDRRKFDASAVAERVVAETGLVAKWVFERWCVLTGRRV